MWLNIKQYLRKQRKYCIWRHTQTVSIAIRSIYNLGWDVFLRITSDYFWDTVSEDQLRIKLTERQRSGVVVPNLFDRIRIRRNIVCYKKFLNSILFDKVKHDSN